MNNLSARYLLAALFIDGLLWIRSGYSKLSSGRFVDGLSETLQKFASQNPYPWYKQILNDVAISNSVLLGNVIMYSEIASAVILIAVTLFLFGAKRINNTAWLLLILSLATLSAMNVLFWLAAGWTSPSADSLNLLMLGLQLVGILAILRLNKAG